MVRAQSEWVDRRFDTQARRNSTVTCVILALLLMGLNSCSQPVQSVTEPKSLFDVDSVALPSFPDSLSFSDFKGGEIAQANLGIQAGSPGEDDRIWVMRPNPRDRWVMKKRPIHVFSLPLRARRC